MEMMHTKMMMKKSNQLKMQPVTKELLNPVMVMDMEVDMGVVAMDMEVMDMEDMVVDMEDMAKDGVLEEDLEVEEDMGALEVDMEDMDMAKEV